MDPYNLAICFGPTLMPIPDGQDPVACQAHVNEVIKSIIINHEVIFPNQRELDGPVYEKCMTGGEEYWWVVSLSVDELMKIRVIFILSSIFFYLSPCQQMINYEISLYISLCSDSPHSEPGTIDEADNGTEPHTSDEGKWSVENLSCLLVRCIVISVCF